ncbi:MAG TPA: diaminopimelate epimerase [Stellaceae bacterium]|nr:diaminopimelate epimerase [Stellaceae bacterium]
MTGTPFVKMHGLGNDFVVFDARDHALALDDAHARAIADRHTGVGCDQLLVMERPRDPKADVFMRIRNADGDEVEACGNGTRCIAAALMHETGKRRVTIETVAGLLEASDAGSARVTVDMGPARLQWREIPLARECDTLHVPLTLGPVSDPVATNMGNPHATFFVSDAEAVDVAGLGRELERHPMFPERANIGFVSLIGKDRLRFRVWERGVGITIACGTGACAAGVAAARRGLTGRKVTVVADGGPLEIEWRADGHVLMTGPVAVSFTGILDPALLG